MNKPSGLIYWSVRFCWNRGRLKSSNKVSVFIFIEKKLKLLYRNKDISSVLYGWNSVSIHIFFSRCTQYFLKGYIKIYELQMRMKPPSFYLMFSRKYSLSFYYSILEQKKIKPSLKCMNGRKYKFLIEMPGKMSILTLCLYQQVYERYYLSWQISSSYSL